MPRNFSGNCLAIVPNWCIFVTLIKEREQNSHSNGWKPSPAFWNGNYAAYCRNTVYSALPKECFSVRAYSSTTIIISANSRVGRQLFAVLPTISGAVNLSYINPTSVHPFPTMVSPFQSLKRLLPSIIFSVSRSRGKWSNMATAQGT